jgi:D-glycero-D-manno-heptose 1,7-bisphosphate phosphatase
MHDVNGTPPRAVLLDRDGVLNVRPPTGSYVRSWAEWRWLPGVPAAIARLGAAGIRIAVITNQAGLARGLMTEADLADIHARMRTDLAAAGGGVDAIFHCPHYVDDGCDCRKPKPGMLLAAQRLLGFDMARTPFVGDDDRDRQAAAAEPRADEAVDRMERC